ncbi:MAG: hypothetical protein ABI776_14015 [Nocardioidaceae bacterium]
MRPVELASLSLDAGTAALVRPALAWLGERSGPGGPSPDLVRELLDRELPRRWQGRQQHEVAWALGDLFQRAGLADQAAACRSRSTHERLARWQWTQSFTHVPAAFWQPALTALQRPGDVPARAALSLSSAHALLTIVGDGLRLTSDGQLPLVTVQALDDRFRWTEEFPWMRVTEESAVAPLRLLHEHLVAQRLLVHDDGRVTRTAAGVAGTRSTATLWRAVVDPAPRWTREFERDALGVMAASVLRSADLALGRIGEEMTHVLAAKWRPTGSGGPSNVFDGASPLAQAWYHLGVPLGWWDTGRGPADRTLNAIGWSAAVSVFRAVAGPVRGSVDGPPG